MFYKGELVREGRAKIVDDGRESIDIKKEKSICLRKFILRLEIQARLLYLNFEKIVISRGISIINSA